MAVGRAAAAPHEGICNLGKVFLGTALPEETGQVNSPVKKKVKRESKKTTALGGGRI